MLMKLSFLRLQPQDRSGHFMATFLGAWLEVGKLSAFVSLREVLVDEVGFSEVWSHRTLEIEPSFLAF